MIKQSQETYRLNYWVQIVLWKKKLEYAAQATIKIAEIIIKDCDMLLCERNSHVNS